MKDFEFFDPDFDGPRICATRQTSASISAKQGKDEMELVMGVYNVSEAEAWKILEKKARRRQERAEQGEATEEQEPREMEVLK